MTLLSERDRAPQLPVPDEPRPLLWHLSELRERLLRALAFWAAGAAVSYAAFPRVLAVLVRPPVERLVFTSPAEPFLAQIKLSFLGGFVLAFPWILREAWAFVAPALKPSESAALRRLIAPSAVLFLLGGAFGLFAAAPLALKFLMSYSSPVLTPYITLDAYLGFVGSLVLGMGLLFQIPVVLYALSTLGLVRAETLSHRRRHAVLVILIAAALLTPGPDVVSQLIVAAAGYLLFELSILAIRLARSP